VYTLRVSAKRIKVEVWACVCERCGHEWQSFGEELPMRCAAKPCKSPYWLAPVGAPRGRPKTTAEAPASSIALAREQFRIAEQEKERREAARKAQPAHRRRAR
jgi:hypothetical protein